MKKVLLTDKAKKDISKLDKLIKLAIIKKLQSLQKEELEPIPLTGSWKGWYKIRSGDYRILLTKQSPDWIVGYIRHRREVYKN